MYKILNYYVCSITFLTVYNCNAMLETLATMQAAALAAGATSQAIKPLVKEAEHLFGHHKRHQQRMQANAQQQLKQQEPAAPQHNFLDATKEKLVEKGSEALAEATVKTISCGVNYIYQALTIKTQQQQQPAALAQAEAPQVIVLKIRRQPSRHYHRKNSYSSTEESGSRRESSDDSDSESDSSYHYHRRHSHYHHPYNHAKLSHHHS